MTVKDLIKYLSKFDEKLDVVFYNETLDENHWGCELNIDDANGKDLIIVPTIEDQTTNPNSQRLLGFSFYIISTSDLQSMTDDGSRLIGKLFKYRIIYI